VARLGGDEFIVIIPCLTDNKELAISRARDIAENIHKQLNLAFSIQGQEVFLSTSMGITLFPEQGNIPPDQFIPVI
jgi:GGDEF domain-containing protein